MKQTNDLFLSALKRYRGKKVTVLHSGGVNSTALILGLSIVGVKRLRVLHVELPENVTGNCNMELIAARNISEYVGYSLRTAKLSGVEGDLTDSPTYKHSLITQILPAVTDGTDDVILFGLGASTLGGGFVSTLQAAFRNSPYWIASDKRRTTKLEFPLLKLSRRVTYAALKQNSMSHINNLELLTANCDNRSGNLILNGIHEPCGICTSCTSFKTPTGPIKSSVSTLAIERINGLFIGGQSMHTMLKGDSIVNVVVNSDKTISHVYNYTPLCEARCVDTVKVFGEYNTALPVLVTKGVNKATTVPEMLIGDKFEKERNGVRSAIAVHLHDLATHRLGTSSLLQPIVPTAAPVKTNAECEAKKPAKQYGLDFITKDVLSGEKIKFEPNTVPVEQTITKDSVVPLLKVGNGKPRPLASYL